MKLVFIGTPEWAMPSLEALVESGHKVAGVLTQPDRRAGRTKMPTPSPVKQQALEWGLRVFSPEKAGSPETLELLHELTISGVFWQFLVGPPAAFRGGSGARLGAPGEWTFTL